LHYYLAMQSRRPLVSWLFALALLFGQAAAFAHALTHLRPHESNLPDKVCEVCVAQAQLGAAAAPTPVVAPYIPAVHAVAAPPAIAHSDPARIVARARAPPVRSV
jgi:hypothetical protein